MVIPLSSKRISGEAHVIAVGVLLIVMALCLVIVVQRIIIEYLKRALLILGG